MPHIDEGELHAWLDRERSGLTGAELVQVESHLVDCLECRARLDDARSFKEQAKRILSLAGPTQIAQPDFQVLASPSPGSRTAWRRRFLAAAWAASMVSAVGVGWWTRELARPDQLAFQETATAASDAQATPPMSPQANQTNEASQVDGAVRNSVVAGEPTRTAPATYMEVTAEEARALGIIASSSEPPPTAGSRVEEPARQGVVDDLAVGLAARETSAIDVGNEPSAAGFSDATVQSRAVLASPPPSSAGVAAPVSAPAWVTVDGTAAEQRLGWSPMSVADLPVVQVEVADQEGTGLARVSQRLEGGGILTLTQQRFAYPAKPETEGATVSLRVGDLFVTAVAPIDAEALRTLLERIR